MLLNAAAYVCVLVAECQPA